MFSSVMNCAPAAARAAAGQAAVDGQPGKGDHGARARGALPPARDLARKRQHERVLRQQDKRLREHRGPAGVI